MTTSRVPALIDYLVAQFQAASTLGGASPPVLVFDGPPTSADPAPLGVYVGVGDVFADTPPTAATSEQTAVGLAQKREELATIHLAAVAWAGTDDMKTVRASAYAIAAAVEDLVRADTALAGLPGAALARPGVTGIVLQQNNTAQGAVAQVSFQITYRTLIGV